MMDLKPIGDKRTSIRSNVVLHTNETHMQIWIYESLAYNLQIAFIYHWRLYLSTKVLKAVVNIFTMLYNKMGIVDT